MKDNALFLAFLLIWLPTRFASAQVSTANYLWEDVYSYMNLSIIIKGKIKFEDHVNPFMNATLHVYLENVSLVDASSKVVGCYERRNINFPSNKLKIMLFKIAGENLDERESYALRAHVDINGDGSVSKGDFINMQSYPVATFGYPRQLSILVRQVE